MVSAQDLSTEVVVDRNIIPEERSAARPSWLAPEILLPPTQTVELQPVTYTGVAALDRQYTQLPAADGAYAAEKTPYRGYVAGGYFPTLDFGISAGYRLLDKKTMSLGARLQLDSERYRPSKDVDAPNYFFTTTIGVDYRWQPTSKSTLAAFAEYAYLRDRTYFFEPQSINSGAVGASWRQEVGRVNIHASLRGDFEHLGKVREILAGNTPWVDPLSQQRVRFAAGMALPLADSRIGIDVDGDYLRTAAETASTKGFVALTPHYTYVSRRFVAKIGVKLDIADKFNVMPDVRVQWNVADAFSIWANVTGGSHVNSFASLRQVSVYQIFRNQFELSRVPLALDGGLNFGPYKGFYVGVFGGYAIANKWMMLAGGNSFYGGYSAFAPVNIKGWHAGAKIGGEWRFIKAEALAEFAPSDYDKAWYFNRDRAKVVVGAHLSLTPIKPLTVTVGYEFRGGRKAYYSMTEASGTKSDKPQSTSLGCVSDLSVGAEYRINTSLAVFARVENILGRRFEVIDAVVSRRQSGLVGVSYKF